MVQLFVILLLNNMIEIEIKKSKFLGYYFKVENADEVKEILENLKKENKKATHVCYAYRITKDQYLEKAFDSSKISNNNKKNI